MGGSPRTPPLGRAWGPGRRTAVQGSVRDRGHRCSHTPCPGSVLFCSGLELPIVPALVSGQGDREDLQERRATILAAERSAVGPKLAAWARRAGGSLTWRSEQRKVSLLLSSGISASLQFISLPPAPFPDVFCSPRRAGGGVRGAGRG